MPARRRPVLSPSVLFLPVPVGVATITTVAAKAGHPLLHVAVMEPLLAVTVYWALTMAIWVATETGRLDVALVAGGPADGQRLLLLPWHSPRTAWLETPAGSWAYRRRGLEDAVLPSCGGTACRRRVPPLLALRFWVRPALHLVPDYRRPY